MQRHVTHSNIVTANTSRPTNTTWGTWARAHTNMAEGLERYTESGKDSMSSRHKPQNPFQLLPRSRCFTLLVTRLLPLFSFCAVMQELVANGLSRKSRFPEIPSAAPSRFDQVRRKTRPSPNTGIHKSNKSRNLHRRLAQVKNHPLAIVSCRLYPGLPCALGKRPKSLKQARLFLRR